MGESRARLGAALVSVAVTLFHVAPASAEVLTTTEWRDNPIRGTTPSELLAYMRGHMIADEDGPAFANITHDHKLTVTTRPAGNSCRVQNLSFSFAFVITLPKALDEGRMTPATRAIWRQFVDYTKWHEAHHRALFLDCAARFTTEARKMEGDSCAGLEKRARALVDARYAACMTVQRDFDRREAPRVAALGLMRSGRTAQAKK